MSGGFVDIHSHILYGLDDGASSFDESLAMMEIAQRAGTVDIVATPHANSTYQFDSELIAHRIEQLQARTSVRIHTGCDFHLQSDNIEDALEHPDKYPINHAGYLLVEFPDHILLPHADSIFSRLLGAGMVPVITHPERNGLLVQRIDDLSRWVEMGCCIQVTADSCTGRFGRRAKSFVNELVERGLVHFVASDAHGSRARTPSLQEAYDELVTKWGEALVTPMFVDNPRAALTGEPVEAELPAPIAPRKWYRFWA